jgi:ectoine hydroxylase-related dioxygenase (phytanoyl-CoA dioxygenase family)
MRITDTHLSTLRKTGYVVIKNFLTPPELDSARGAFRQYYPTPEELADTPHRFGGMLEDAEQLQTEFPFADDTLNHLSLHPAILSAVSRFYGHDDIRLSQAAIWAKYAGYGDYEQGLHFDYQGNTLVVPRHDGDYQQLNFIIYYTDVTKSLGPTAVLSFQQTEELDLWPAFKTKVRHPELYAAEKKVIVPAGSMLIFTMGTLHRATQITAGTGARFSHHLVYRSGRHNFQGYHLYSRLGEREDLQRWMQSASPEQRHALGFPRPGDAYWTPQTLRSVARRYPRLDLAPYRNNG